MTRTGAPEHYLINVCKSLSPQAGNGEQSSPVVGGGTETERPQWEKSDLEAARRGLRALVTGPHVALQGSVDAENCREHSNLSDHSTGWTTGGKKAVCEMGGDLRSVASSLFIL